MPRYADGTEPAEGDVVIGKLPNGAYRVVGTILAIGGNEAGLNCQIRKHFGIAGRGATREMHRLAGQEIARCEDFRKIVNADD